MDEDWKQKYEALVAEDWEKRYELVREELREELRQAWAERKSIFIVPTGFAD